MVLTPTLLFAVLALAFVVGIALGYICNRAGEVWRRRFIVERDYYSSYRDQSDAVLRGKLNRIARLEGERHGDPPAPAEVIAIAPLPPLPDSTPAEPDAPLPATTDEAAPPPAEPAPPVPRHPELETDFFGPAPVPEAVIAPSLPATEEAEALPIDSETRHLLTRLGGLTPDLADKLDGLGVRSLTDIETLSAEDEMALEMRLGVPAGFIARHQWRLQAALLSGSTIP